MKNASMSHASFVPAATVTRCRKSVLKRVVVSKAASRIVPRLPLSGSTTKRVLPLLSELVAVQSITTSFETLAGRSAMLGFAVAFSVEVASSAPPSGGIFGHLERANTFGEVLIVMVACSASAAAFSTRGSALSLGRRLLEPILASLTSQSRSAGAVSGRDVDTALDSAMDSVFNPAFVLKTFPVENEIEI